MKNDVSKGNKKMKSKTLVKEMIKCKEDIVKGNYKMKTKTLVKGR